MASASLPTLASSRILIAVVVVLCVMPDSGALPLPDVIAQAMATPVLQRHRRAATQSPCTPPDNLQERFQNLNSLLNHTDLLRPAANGQAMTAVEGEQPQVVEGDPNETKTCPSSLPEDGSAPLAHRSLCPYFFNLLQLPAGYYPPTLRSAQCKCQQCVHNSAFGCEPVMTPVLVLRPAGCLDGLQKYTEETLQLQTSCLCAFKAAPATDSPAPSWGVN